MKKYVANGCILNLRNLIKLAAPKYPGQDNHADLSSYSLTKLYGMIEEYQASSVRFTAQRKFMLLVLQEILKRESLTADTFTKENSIRMSKRDTQLSSLYPHINFKLN